MVKSFQLFEARSALAEKWTIFSFGNKKIPLARNFDFEFWFPISAMSTFPLSMDLPTAMTATFTYKSRRITVILGRHEFEQITLPMMDCRTPTETAWGLCWTPTGTASWSCWTPETAWGLRWTADWAAGTTKHESSRLAQSAGGWHRPPRTRGTRGARWCGPRRPRPGSRVGPAGRVWFRIEGDMALGFFLTLSRASWKSPTLSAAWDAAQVAELYSCWKS